MSAWFVACKNKEKRYKRVDYREPLQKSLDYIEAHLKTEITAPELASDAGFSLYHYYRLFLSAVGMPVMQYITRQKLLHAIYEISRGRKMVDAALEYGFDTYAGFYKAFKRELGYTPAAFLQKYPVVNKPYRINLFQEEHIMVTHAKIRQLLKEYVRRRF